MWKWRRHRPAYVDYQNWRDHEPTVRGIVRETGALCPMATSARGPKNWSMSPLTDNKVICRTE